MHMQRIALDMDGVLADEFNQVNRFFEAHKGLRITHEEALGKKLSEAVPNAHDYILSEGFFRTAPVIEGSQEVVRRLQDHYEVFIVSAAVEYPRSLNEKLDWLAEHFPFIGWQHIVFCGSKTIVAADIMIDDNFKNLDPFPGKTLLFNQPHNQLADPGRHQRVFSWEEIAGLLLPKS